MFTTKSIVQMKNSGHLKNQQKTAFAESEDCFTLIAISFLEEEMANFINKGRHDS